MMTSSNVFLALFCSILSVSSESESIGTPPNIVFILLDDLGWHDTSFNGGKYPTPNIDILKSHSIELTRHYIHLMCSPSRTQFLTGRYAMYQGIGIMYPWDETEIGGIPIGQPTIANWLKVTQNYTNYAVGKWHIGYAYEGLTPTFKGFDHFVGFYQGAIKYNTLQYIDIEFGDTIHYDFWEDAKPYANVAQMLESYTTNNQTFYSMNLYRDKIIEYIEIEANKLKDDTSEKNPFYMYLPLQTLHTPLPALDEYTTQCDKYLGDAKFHKDHKLKRQSYRYCENTIATDVIIGEIMNSLKLNNLWENTLIVFTSDNGGDITITGCNYPLRGTKGVEFDGNTRVIALIGGGVIPAKHYGTTRDTLFSSLDWTPTLLHFAGGLQEINQKDYTWDGFDQYDLIMNNIDAANRDHITFNIGTIDLESASIVFKYGNNQNLHKYISGGDRSIDKWFYARIDGWCHPDENNIFDILEVDDNMPLAQDADQKYLFDVTKDPTEKVNLLKLDSGDTEHIIQYAKSILARYTMHPLYAEHFEFLWDRQSEGDPMQFDDGFVHPFLNENDYLLLLEKGFDDNEIKLSKELKTLYFDKWEPPSYLLKKSNPSYEYVSTTILWVNQYKSYIYMAVSILTCLLMLFVLKGCNNWMKNKLFDRNGYEPLKSDDNI